MGGDPKPRKTITISEFSGSLELDNPQTITSVWLSGRKLSHFSNKPLYLLRAHLIPRHTDMKSDVFAPNRTTSSVSWYTCSTSSLTLLTWRIQSCFPATFYHNCRFAQTQRLLIPQVDPDRPASHLVLSTGVNMLGYLASVLSTVRRIDLV